MFCLRNCCLRFWLSIVSLKLHLSGGEDHSAKLRNGKGTSYILEPALPFHNISADRSELWHKLTMFLKPSMLKIAKYVCSFQYFCQHRYLKLVCLQDLCIKNLSLATGFLWTSSFMFGN